jgi:predicted dehydrogenase
MSERIRLAVVGYGYRGRSMSRLAARSFADIELVAVCDTSPAALENAVADHPDAARFRSFDQMLDSVGIDALLVETPATEHGDYCVEALRRDIHVMGDVPAVESIEQAWKLWEAQKQSKAFYMIGANPNLAGFVEAGVDLIEKGMLGDIYLAEAEYIHDLRPLYAATPWRETYESVRYCTHSLGPVLRWLDDELVTVSCFDTGSHVSRKPGQHDAMVALFRTPGNAVVRFLTSFVNNVPSTGHRYRLYGTKGYFERTPAYEGAGSAKTLFYSTELYADHKLIELPIDRMRPEYTRTEYLHVEPGTIGPHNVRTYALFERFFAAIRSGGPSPIGVRAALAMTLPGIYAAESARRGGELLQIEYPWSGSAWSP